MHKRSIRWIFIPAVTFLILGCGAPSVLRVDGVRVEPPSDQGKELQRIVLPVPLSAAIDSITLDLLRMGFIIKESDRQLGVVQTDDKILAESEDFKYEYSPEQEAAGGTPGAFKAGIGEL